MDFAAEILFSHTMQALGWALVHFVWQGALLGLIAMVFMATPITRSPHIRYGIGLTVLAAMVLTPLYTFGTNLERPAVNTTVLVHAQYSNPLNLTPDLRDGAHAKGGEMLPVSNRPQTEITPNPHREANLLQYWKSQRAYWGPYAALGVLAWLIGVLFMAIRNLVSWLMIVRLRKAGVTPVPEHVARLVASLQTRMGIQRAVMCLQSSRIAIPGVIGWLRPVVLLPTSTLLGLEVAQLEAVLAHELAHIRRHDFLINLLQTAVETVLFYHPAVWWVSRQIRLERELCCDDLVVRTCANPVAYAEALVRVASMRRVPEYALAATGGNLLHRIRRIAEPLPTHPSNSGNAALSIAIVLGVCTALLLPNLHPLWAQAGSGTPGARSITFPEWSMGQVMTRPWGSQVGEEWVPFQPASGVVEIPPGTEVQLLLDNSAVTDLSPLGNLGTQDLQSISFSRTEVQNDQLAYIEGLELRELDFELTEITNEALSYIDDMTSLESLSVGRTNVDNEGMTYLSGLTGLRRLDLNLTGVNDEGLAQLENLRSLEDLDLWEANITDEGLRFIGTLEQLRILGLEGAPITDAGLAYLGNLRNLEDLNLENTPIGDEGLAYLARLDALRILILKSTRVTDAGIALLRQMAGLESVSVPNQIAMDTYAQLDNINVQAFHSGGQRYTIRVEDSKVRRPVAMAHIELKGKPQGGSRFMPHYFWTGESGDVKFYYPREHVVDVKVDAPGYVPTTESWDLAASDVITVTLTPAAVVGGIVVDESGDPVAGVSVGLSVPGDRDYAIDQVGHHTEKSGDDGQWRCEHAPSDLSTLSIELEHPEYASTSYSPAELSPARLKAATEQLVIEKGFAVEGIVVDPQGAPIVGATVTELELRRGDLYGATENSARTDEEGNFDLANQVAKTVKLKVNAGGYLPLVEDADFSADSPPLRFTLTPGQLLKGRVVDGTGMALEGVRVETPRYLATSYKDHISTSLKTATDSEGRFLWDEAPESAINLRFSKRGYATLQMDITASEEEIVIVMGPALVVSGVILDAATGDPITTAQAVVLARAGENTMRANNNFRTAENGSYSMALSESFNFPGVEMYQVVLSAPGYEDETSREIGVHEGAVTMNFQLKPVSPISGVLLDMDSSPVPNALVYAFSPNEVVQFQNNAPSIQGVTPANTENKTDDEGRFTITPPANSYNLVAISDRGYVSLNNQDAKEAMLKLTLQPWAIQEIHGVKGTAPDTGTSLVLSRANTDETPSSNMFWVYQKETDKHGSAVFDQIFPGPYMLHNVAMGPQDTHAMYQEVVVASDETETVEIGGWGQPVGGKVNIPAELSAKVNWEQSRVSLIASTPSPRLPGPFSELKPSDKSKFLKHVRETLDDEEAAGPSWTAIQYYATVDEAGQFQFQDVVPGKYALELTLYSVPVPSTPWELTVLEKFTRDIEVPLLEDGRSDELYDIGTLATGSKE